MTVPTVAYKKFVDPEPASNRRFCAVLLICFMLMAVFFVPPMVMSYVEIFEDEQQSSPVVDYGPAPPHTEYAKMARFIVHKAEWVSMGSISTLDSIKGFPMVNIIAVADSALGAKSTGTLYFYLTMLDYTAQDLRLDNRLTVLLSMDQDLACTKQGVDPMEPTCARIMISGKAVKLANDTEEFSFGTAAMISRHPASKHWLNTHNFFLCKLDMLQIAVLDWYGGPHYVTLEDYYKSAPDSAQGVSNEATPRHVLQRFASAVNVD